MAVLWSLTVAMNSRQFSFTSVDYQAVVSILGSWNDTLPVNGTYCGAPTLSAPSYRPLTGYNLSKLVVVHRHGDRSPVNVIPDDVRMTWDCKSMVEYSFLQDEPHTNGWNMQKALVGRKVVRIENEIWKPKMWGGSCLQAELTTKGREHLIDFGSNIRQIYVDRLGFLPSQYNSSNFLRVRSTDLRRTLQSAQSFLEGLYPYDSRSSNPEPIRFHTHPIETDPLHSNKLFLFCPKLAHFRRTLEKDPVYQAYLAAATDYIKYVNKIVGPEISDDEEEGQGLRFFTDLEKITTVGSHVENLMCRHCWHKNLPCRNIRRKGSSSPIKQCINSTDIARLYLYKSFEYYFKDSYYPNTHEKDMIRLQIGPFLHELRSVLSEPSSKGHLFHHFSTHDGTVSQILGAFQAPVDIHTWPSYRANLVFELWKKPLSDNTESSKTGGYNAESVVRVFYNGQPLKTPWCDLGEGCSMKDFINFLEDKIPRSWEEECQLDVESL
ncbi:histidine phosphatase superfamily [Paraphysoderma sedebokerense]|nr:histidine phosphatase superfamily [Paraphysoderma sedebokerense]